MTVAQCFCPDAGSSTGTSDAATESGPFDAAAESSATDAESSVDAGAESAAASACPQTCMSLAPPVPPGSASDPTTTPLWFALRGASGPGQHDMPYTPSSFVFSQQDLDLISTWIKQGAQDN